ncbi:MAG: fatty acid CoA ligase family protein [Pseudomonadota bacterium]
MTQAKVVNISTFLTQMAARSPYKKAVIRPAGRDKSGRLAYTHLTFEQLDHEADRLAHGLVKTGLAKGTRTIVMVGPSLEFFALTFAMFRVGAVPVLVDPGMGLDRMLTCLQEGRPEAFIGIPKAHVLRTLRPKYFKTVKKWITVGRRWYWGGPTLNGIRQEKWTPFEPAATLADETAAILFTTGSTGPAKGVVYTYANFAAQIRQIQAHWEIGPDEIDLPTFPLFALFDPALGMTAVIPDMDPTRPALVDPEKIIEPILDHGVTNMFASPALLHRVGAHGAENGLKLPSLRRVVSAGAPVHPANIEQFSALLTGGAEVHTPYGATEAVPVSSIAGEEILTETRELTDQGGGNCVGRPLAGTEIEIIAIHDDPIAEWSSKLRLPDGEVGEITVKGDVVAREYFERPRDTALAVIKDRDGFRRRMGDLGWRDKKGRIWFCGRKSHRVITAGETLFTIPCEAVFNNHPLVYRAALVGVGPQGNQKPVICIEPHKKIKVPKDELKKELLALARETPMTSGIEAILFHDSFPVDIRHNSKIFREKLAVWAAGKLKVK